MPTYQTDCHHKIVFPIEPMIGTFDYVECLDCGAKFTAKQIVEERNQLVEFLEEAQKAEREHGVQWI